MCTGVEIALIAAAAVSAGGALYQGEQQRKAASENADIAERAALAEKNAAAYNEELHRERVRKILSTQRALYGKSGLDMSGSPLLVMEDTAAQGELDALAIRYGGDVAAAKERSIANLSRMQGSAAATSSYFSAGSTLLSAGSSYYGNQMKLQPKGTG